MKQVLLLDDNAAQLTIREMVLRKAGIESNVVSSAQAALDLLHSGAGRDRIGVVITDHLMPGMGGREFVKELRTFNTNLTVVVISGLPDVDEEYQDLNVIFRVKPVDPDDLIALVRNALNSYPYRASA